MGRIIPYIKENKNMFQTTNQLVYGRYIYTDWWCTYPSEKYEVSMGRITPYIMESKKCSKPPTSWFMVDISILIGGIPDR